MGVAREENVSMKQKKNKRHSKKRRRQEKKEKKKKRWRGGRAERATELEDAKQ